MNVDKVRSEFESRFPVPNGVIWSDDAYHLVNEKACTKLSHLFYLGRWETWQASRAALVFELPVVDEREWAVTSDECAAMREGIEVMARRIESSGFKVNRPPKPVAPERACPGCGEKGFSANCMQCIPY